MRLHFRYILFLLKLAYPHISMHPILSYDFILNSRFSTFYILHFDSFYSLLQRNLQIQFIDLNENKLIEKGMEIALASNEQ